MISRFLAVLMILSLPGLSFTTELLGASARTFESVLEEEEKANAALAANLLRWDGDKLRELSRNIASMPESNALHAVWLMASAPAKIDTTHVLASALSSPHATVRSAAADVLIAGGGSAGRRMLLALLATENEPEVVSHIVNGLAMQPTERAVRNMMDIMFESGLKSPAIETAAGQLRRLTRVNLSDSPADWRDWWLDNEMRY